MKVKALEAGCILAGSGDGLSTTQPTQGLTGEGTAQPGVGNSDGTEHSVGAKAFNTWDMDEE